MNTQPTYDLSSIGEGQIRFTVEHGERLMSANHLRMSPACSEANVAGVLAQLGRNTLWTSALPDDDLADRIVTEYHSVGVNMDAMIRKPNGRTAIYFMEPAEPPIPSRVVYDREHTVFRSTGVNDYDWDTILDTRIMFLTGITAALTDTTAEVVQHAADEAHKRGVKVALDVNFRRKLWTGDKARSVLAPVAEKADILFCSISDAKNVFDITGSPEHVTGELQQRFGCEHIVSTNHLEGPYLRDHDTFTAYTTTPIHVIDRPGAGDSFVSGVLHGYLSNDIKAGIHWGQVASAFALTHRGDLTRIHPHELDIPLGADIDR